MLWKNLIYPINLDIEKPALKQNRPQRQIFCKSIKQLLQNCLKNNVFQFLKKLTISNGKDSKHLFVDYFNVEKQINTSFFLKIVHHIQFHLYEKLWVFQVLHSIFKMPNHFCVISAVFHRCGITIVYLHICTVYFKSL